MDINWKEIKEKHPKLYNNFVQDIILTKGLKTNEILSQEVFHKNICYCNLERFFDDNGIFIEIYRRHTFSDWAGVVGDNFMFSLIKDDIKIKAVFKAFEILENKLKDGKINE